MDIIQVLTHDLWFTIVHKEYDISHDDIEILSKLLAFVRVIPSHQWITHTKGQ